MQKSISFKKKSQNFLKVGLTVQTKFVCVCGTARVGRTARPLTAARDHTRQAQHNLAYKMPTICFCYKNVISQYF